MRRKPDIACLNCGKMFHPTRKGSTFCCRQCASEYNKLHGKYSKSEETRKKLSEARKGKEPWNKGKKASAEAIEKFRESIKGVWTEEKRKEQSEKQKVIWSDPELLERHSKKCKEHMTEEYKKEISKKTKVAMSNPELKQRMIDICIEKYGVKYFCLSKPCQDASKVISKINRYWQEELNIKDEDLEFVLDGYSYDLKKGNTLIEIDPTFTHTCIDNVRGEGHKERSYHIRKTCVANKHGYDCVHIWDWDDVEKVKNLLSDDKEILYARKLSLREVNKEDADLFLNTYHLQNTCKGQIVCLGLYKDEELVELMTFGKPRYNKEYQWELLRLCTNSKYRIVGGSEKLFTYFKEKFLPVSIISYCDKSKFSGKVYIDLGFTLLVFNAPSKHWYNINTGRHITDNLLRQRGFSQLHNDQSYSLYKKGDNNEVLMLENGYLPIYDCGQSTYIWHNEQS